MRFAQPAVLYALAGVPLLAALLALSIARRRRALEMLASARLMDRMVTRVSTQRLVVKSVLACLGAAFLILALARPQWGMTLDPVTRRGVDVVLAFDISTSMLAEDLRPSRLDKARSDASRLLDMLDGDRVAVVAFAGSAATFCPLTLDYGAAQLFIDALEPGILSDAGTSLPLALEEIASVYSTEERRFRAAVIFSDGEDHQGGLEEAAGDAAEEGIIIHTVGVGTQAGGPIPLRRTDGSMIGYKEDREGKVVTSRLQESSLAGISSETGGIYVAATPGGGEISRIAEAIGSMEEREMQQKLLSRYEERFQIPLALGIFCLLADALIPDRLRRRAARPGLSRAAALLLVALAGVTAPPILAASAPELVKEGNRKLEAGEIDEALRLYREAQEKRPDAPEIHLNIGNALYRKGEFEAARESYRRAWSARSRELAGSARYNSGTAGLTSGDLEGAVEDYKEALRLDPDDADARRNLELALRKLQQMQPPPSSQQQKQGEGEKQEKQEGSPDQDRSGEDGEDRGDQGAPPDQGRDRKEGESGSRGERLEQEEARRILDAMKGEDKPRVDPGRQRRPEREPEKDW